MDVLVLGGTRFVGRALVADARRRGWRVMALHRGVTGRLPDEVETLTADRTDPAAFAAAVDGRTWDVVVDTWAGAPRVATATAAALRGRVGRYGYVSSQSVYVWGEHVDETSPVVDADSASDVDTRDLAAYLLDAVAGDVSGPVDVASRSGHATTRTLLEACVAATGSDATLRWVDEARLAEAGVQPWIQLPCWVPEAGEFAGFLEHDTARAEASGLHCRPVAETVADTWAWMQGEPRPPQRPDRPVHGLPVDLERALLG